MIKYIIRGTEHLIVKRMKFKKKNVIKTSFRFYDGNEVRSVWDEDTSSWMICATDIITVLANLKEPRKY